MQTLTLTKYIVNVYGNTSVNLDSILSVLDDKKYPRGIMELLENTEGLEKIEIYNKESNELLLTTVIL